MKIKIVKKSFMIRKYVLASIALMMPISAMGSTLHRISASQAGSDLSITTSPIDPGAIFVVTQGRNWVYTGQLESTGKLKIPLSSVLPASTTKSQDIVVEEIYPELNSGSQTAFNFIAGPGVSILGHYYVVTSMSFNTGDNIDGYITQKYGPGARLAAWEDLQADQTENEEFIGLFLAGTALPVEGSDNSLPIPCASPNLFVTYQGQELDGARGRYFITNFTGSSPSNCDYTSFASIGNVYLGSYSWSGQALVYIPHIFDDGVVASSESIHLHY